MGSGEETSMVWLEPPQGAVQSPPPPITATATAATAATATNYIVALLV